MSCPDDAVPRTVRRITDRLVAFVDPDAVVLFGSVPKGSAHVGSDIDLLVVWDTELPPGLREAEVRPLCEHATRVDLLVRTPAEVVEAVTRPHSFLYSVLQTGRVVHCRPGYQLPCPAEPVRQSFVEPGPTKFPRPLPRAGTAE